MGRLLHRLSATGALVLTVSMTAVTATLGAAPARADDVIHAPCKDVEVVYARGSGQEVIADDPDGGKSKEARTLRDKLGAHIKAPLSWNMYELGAQKINGFRYPAQAVDDKGLGWFVPILAKASSGGAFNYGISVNDGTEEMAAYLKGREAYCPASAFVLAGYSQGAQVVGETYVEKLDAKLRAPIVYSALFGDPKTYLPEGNPRGLKGGAPKACNGVVSAWRANVPDCRVFEGSLNGRTPYLPTGWTQSTGLWCHDKDYVCGASNTSPFDSPGHMTYSDNSIEQAVSTIVMRLASKVPADKAGGLTTVVKEGSSHQNTLFMIDATGSMSGRIDGARRFAAEQMDSIIARGGKVALAQYRDSFDAEPVTVLSDFTSDAAAIKAKLGTIYADGGGDTPEGLLHGLYTSFNALHWENGASKAAVVLTDAGYHDPDVTAESDGRHVYLKDVVDLSLRIDPVNIYPVVPDYIQGDYEAIADQTSGKVIVDSGDSSAALTAAMASLDARPTVALPLSSYASAVGEPITFDASSSYALNGATLTKFEWDTDGDGVFDVTTDGPVLAHTYPAAFNGVMQVRATDSNGGVGSASATVVVGAAEPEPPLAPTGITATVESTSGNTSTVKLSWAPADTKAAHWGITINDAPLGILDGASNSIEITDVQRGAAVGFSVQGITADWQRGEWASTTLPAPPTGGTTPPPVPPGVQPPASGTTGPAPSAPAPSNVIPTVHLAPAPPRAPVAGDWLPNQVPGQGLLQAQTQGQPAAVSSTVTSPSPSASPAAASSAPSAAPSQARATPDAAAAPADKQAPAKDASPAADFGPLPWILGGIVLVAVAALAVVAARRRNRGL